MTDAEPRALTQTQHAVLAYLVRGTSLRGVQPSYEEICQFFGWASKTAVHGFMKALARKGYLRMAAGASRCAILLRMPDGTPIRGWTPVTTEDDR
jgi:SOS-response transcriptional repressor LexA